VIATPRLTYNPGLLGDEELIQAFVVRQQSLELILQAMRENAVSEGPNRHLLIVGPRGSGKTMLVRRAAAEARINPDYSLHWLPLVFGEESYQVTTAGEFWLEALFHIAEQTGDPKRRAIYLELRDEKDEGRLRERALAQVLDFADSLKRRLLLVVENLNMLLDDQLSRKMAWDLRHTLSHERRIMLLASATTRFEAITNAGQAFFDMFSVYDLRPLDLDECARLWEKITEREEKPGPLRAVRILTGGSPRLLTLLVSFAANRSFRELIEHLVHLIDDHTEYFKGHLDALAAQERKVYVALLERWDPVPAADLARDARLGINEVSSLLGRLTGRGAVEIATTRGRKKFYQVTERLFNIYYLMRRRGACAGRVHAAVSFMVTFYEPDELVARAAEIAREACGLPPSDREDHYLAYVEITERLENIASRILASTPPEFFEVDSPRIIQALPMRVRQREAAERLRGFIDEVRPLFMQIVPLLADTSVRERAMELTNRDVPDLVRSLGQLASLCGSWEPLLESYRELPEAVANVPAVRDACSEILIRAAAAGHVQKVVEVLSASAAIKALEPLLVGLRIYAGETPLVAREVFEVGQDVAARIRELAAAKR
jgi:hypothetical protein